MNDRADESNLEDGMTVHDVFACECHETCSWCTEPVLDRTLRETDDGARVCPACWREYKNTKR